TRLSNARQVFELGSGFGYSTAWFARAVKENGGGIVHHVVWDDRLSREARENLVALGLADVVQFHVGEAVATLQEAAGPFDVIFNDIDKQDYPKALDVITTKLRPGGLLLVDNMLWSGRIFERRDTSPATRGVRELTRRVQADPRWIASVIPVRDGLLVAHRVEEVANLTYVVGYLEHARQGVTRLKRRELGEPRAQEARRTAAPASARSPTPRA